MSTIIGLDTHISTCDYFAIGSDGEIVGAGTVPTSALELRKMAQGIRGSEKIIVAESGPLAQWLRRILSIRSNRVVIAETRRNRWISRDSVKNDRFDAQKLAMLYRGGFVREVVARDDRNERLLRVVIQRHDLVKQMVQIKNRIKAKYRQHGLRAAGISVYSESGRQKWLTQLPDFLSFSVNQYYSQLDLLDEQIAQNEKQLRAIARSYPIVKLLSDKFPGVGLINATTFVALVDTAERFSTEKKLWTYCGLGIDVRCSGQSQGTHHLTYRGNRQLKCCLKSAIHTAIKVSADNPYRKWFLEQVSTGRPEHKALLTAARKLTKDMWITWKEHNKAQQLTVSPPK